MSKEDMSYEQGSVLFLYPSTEPRELTQPQNYSTKKFHITVASVNVMQDRQLKPASL